MTNNRKILCGVRYYAVTTLNTFTKLMISSTLLIAYIVMMVLDLIFTPVQQLAVALELFVRRRTKRIR